MMAGMLTLAVVVTQGADEARFNSTCTCTNELRQRCHGEWRGPVKVETNQPTSAIPASHRLTPSQLAAWPGPGGDVKTDTTRTGKELEWFEVRGRVTLVKVEEDGI